MNASPSSSSTVRVPLKCAMCRMQYLDCASLGTLSFVTGCPAHRIIDCPKFRVCPGLEDRLLDGSFRVVRADTARKDVV